MLTVIGVVAFVIAILVSIALHELGHMIPAKKFGVKVSQYMVGFGPTLWSRVRGETEYGIKGIPLGGYVRMVGMFPPGPEGAAKPSSQGRFATMIEDARRESTAEILTPEDQQRAFYRLSVPKKVIVMMSGPLVNLVLAFLLFAIVMVGFGSAVPTATVDSVVPCIPTATDPTGRATGDTCEQPSPAAKAGLQPGDTITAFNGQPVQSWEDLSTDIRSAGGESVTVQVDRNGESLALPVRVADISRPSTGSEQPAGFIGIGPEFVLEPRPVSDVPGVMWDVTARSAQALITMPMRMVDVAQTALGQEPRDPEGPIGVVGVSRISGEIASATDVPASWRAAEFLQIVASVNLFLFLFNMVPLLPLDGGHIAGALWEGARRRIARWRGQPDPGPFDVARLLPLAYTMAMLLVGMSVLLLYVDIVAPVRLR